MAPEPEAVDKGKRRESTTSGGGHSRSISTPRNIPSGIEIPGPIALTDSNSSRRSGSGRLSETLTSVWGNNPPSAGPSASNSVLASPLEGPTTRSALLNALNPLASVPEGSAIPEVVHADPGAADPGAQIYHNEPPKTPKAETPRPSGSPSRIPVSASAAGTSPKHAATPKAGSRIPTAAVSPRTGGTPRGLSIYSNGSQPPADAAPPEPPATMLDQGAPQSGAQFVATPKGVSRAPTKHSTRSASPLPPAVVPDQGAVLGEPQNLGIPGSVSRVPSKPPTRSASPKPPANTEQENPMSEPFGFTPSYIDAGSHVPAAEAELPALPADAGVPPPAPEQSEPPPAAAEPEAFITPAKSKGSSRKNSKANSKLGSKVGTPKGSQTPKPVETTPSAWGPSASEEAPAADAPRSLSATQSPLATVPEHSIPEVVPSQDNVAPVEAPLEGQSGVPGGFFSADPPVTTPPDPSLPPATTQSESTSFSGFGSLSGGVGGMLGAATSTFGSLGGWGRVAKKDNKSKTSTPGSTTPAWGAGFGAGVAASTASSTGGGGGGGWGAATGNNSRSNSMWPGADTIAQSLSASTTDLFGGGGSNADPMVELDNVRAAELPEYQTPVLPGASEEPAAETGGDGAFQGATEEGAHQWGTEGEGTTGEWTEVAGTTQGWTEGEGATQGWTEGAGATQEESQGAGAPTEETHTRDHLTLNTDVSAEPGAATAAPTTAGESPEGGEGGGDGEGGDEGGGKPPEDDEWAIPMKTKKKKGGANQGGNTAAASTPVSAGGTAPADDWATTTTKKKKKGGKR
jgi:hypothetical protein